MATKLTQKLPNPDAVAAGNTATLRVPVGRRVHQIMLTYPYSANLNATKFDEIRVFVNGNVIQRFSGTQRDKLNQFDGMGSDVTGVLVIPFERTGAWTVGEREMTALNTGSANEAGLMINSLYIEIDINATATIFPSQLRAYSIESDQIAGGAGLIPYIRTELRSVTGADTDFQISDLVNPGVNAPDKIALLRATFVPKNAATINNLRIDRNAYNLFDRTDTLNRIVQTNGIRLPQVGYYSIDTCESGVAADVIQLVNMTDFRYRLDVSGASDINVISEYYGVLTA